MSQAQAVLYDVPGPRARRLTAIVSVVLGVLLLLGAYWFLYRPLATRGEFSMDKWGPVLNPEHENFRAVWRRLGQGFRATLLAAFFAIALSLLCGTLLAVLRMQLKALRRRRFTGLARPLGLGLVGASWGLNAVTRFCVEVLRGIPVVITIFFVWRVLPDLGVRIPSVTVRGVELPALMWSLVIGLTLYNMVVIGEILRSGMEGLPSGQTEAAHAIGLSATQTTMLIQLPQSFRIMLPALISQLVVVFKDTALGFLIGYQEVLRITSQVSEALRPRNPLQMYIVVGAIYILVNYGLSKLAEYVQRRMARSRTTAGLGAAAPPAALAGGQVGGPTQVGGPARAGHPTLPGGPPLANAPGVDQKP